MDWERPPKRAKCETVTIKCETDTVTIKCETVTINIPLHPRYVRGANPPPGPISLLPEGGGTAYILEKVLLPRGVPGPGARPPRLHYVVGWRDVPLARVAVDCARALDYVSPREMEDWEYRDSLAREAQMKKEEEEEMARLVQEIESGAAVKKRIGRPPKKRPNTPGDEPARPSLMTPQTGPIMMLSQEQMDKYQHDLDAELGEVEDEQDELDFEGFGDDNGEEEGDGEEDEDDMLKDMLLHQKDRNDRLDVFDEDFDMADADDIRARLPAPAAGRQVLRARGVQSAAGEPSRRGYTKQIAGYGDSGAGASSGSEVAVRWGIGAVIADSEDDGDDGVGPRGLGLSGLSQSLSQFPSRPEPKPAASNNRPLSRDLALRSPAKRPVPRSTATSSNPSRQALVDIKATRSKASSVNMTSFQPRITASQSKTEREPQTSHQASIPPSKSPKPTNGHPPPKPKPKPKPTSPIDNTPADDNLADASDEWEIERLEGVKYIDDNGTRTRYFKVRWKGDWPPEDNPSWEPESGIDPYAVKDYLRKRKEKKKAAKAGALQNDDGRSQGTLTGWLKPSPSGAGKPSNSAGTEKGKMADGVEDGLDGSEDELAGVGARDRKP